MLFRNDIALCMATAALSCRDKLLMKNLIPANMNLISGKCYQALLFFQILLPPEVTFTSSENIFFYESFIPASKNLLTVWSFFYCWKPWLKLAGMNFNRKIKQFFQMKQLFRIVELYFSTNTSLRVVETDFLASKNHKLCFV